MRHWGSFIVGLLLAAQALAAPGLDAVESDAPIRPRPAVIKPAHTTISERSERHVVWVKFRDGLTIRLRDGKLTDLGTSALREAAAVLDRLKGAAWKRIGPLSEARMDELRAAAEHSLGRAIADFNVAYHLVLPDEIDAETTINQLNALACVELAAPVPLPPPPLPPNFQSSQVYISNPPGGVGATQIWSPIGVTGAGVRLADIEYEFNSTHADLPPVTVLGHPITPTVFGNDHGTATLGQIIARSNGWGTTGLAYNCSPYFVGVEAGGFWDVAGAIFTALGTLQAGDVILIEQQVNGPPSFEAYVPVEWLLGVYNAVLMAVGNGVIVVEAAGNGAQDLDAPPYSTASHAPFLAENDSGAVIVGAGAAPFPLGSTTDRSRLGYSTYGSRVSLQGWGESVVTTGYGDLWIAGGQNFWYTGFFSGTSSASPIVAGACVLLQSAYKQVHGGVLSPQALREALRVTGSPQQSGQFPASQHIGPRPRVRDAALLFLDCNGNGAIDSIDISSGTSSDCNRNGIPDECDVPDQFTISSPALSPIGSGSPQTFSFLGPPPAFGQITLTFQAVGDLGDLNERITVRLNGALVGTVFSSGAHDCPSEPDIATLTMQATAFNAAIAGGLAEITMTASSTVDATACGGQSQISVTVAYLRGTSADADGNGVPDECQPAPAPADLNGDGVVNSLDLGILLSAWSIPATAPGCGGASPCPSDLNGDGFVNSLDLGVLLAAWTI